MKITINTETKTITLLESCKFSEVEKLIKELGGEWNIEVETPLIQWKERVVEKHNPYRVDPWLNPIVYCSTTNTVDGQPLETWSMEVMDFGFKDNSNVKLKPQL